jgi:hypothetical protein
VCRLAGSCVGEAQPLAYIYIYVLLLFVYFQPPVHVYTNNLVEKYINRKATIFLLKRAAHCT